MKTLLEKYGVEIDETDYITENNLNENVEILESKVSSFCGATPEFSKSDSAVTHDAQCLSMVSHLQEKEASSVIEAKTFFLTTDWSLIRLQRLDRDYKDKIDVAVLPSQLMQLFCMTSPTTDYFEAFLGLFSSSKASFGMNALANEQIQEVLGRVAMYKGTTPAFAEKVLSNQLIQLTFSQQESEEEKKQLIDHTMISMAEDMEEEITLKKQELDEKEKVLKQSQEALQKADEQMQMKTSDIKKLVEEKEILAQRNKEIESKLGEALKYKNKYEKRVRRKASAMAGLQYGGGIVMFVIGIILIMSIMAIFPMTLKLVQPIFQYIEIQPTEGIITIFVAWGGEWQFRVESMDLGQDIRKFGRNI